MLDGIHRVQIHSIEFRSGEGISGDGFESVRNNENTPLQTACSEAENGLVIPGPGIKIQVVIGSIFTRETLK